MRKEKGKDRHQKTWCYGKDLHICESLSTNNENWKFIQRFVDDFIGDCYLISNIGRVFDCDKQKLCKQYLDNSNIKKAYVLVSLTQCPEGHKNYKIHRLVALAFVTNPKPNKKVEVHHINGIRTDNRAENLLWVSRTEHIMLHILKKQMNLDTMNTLQHYD